MTDPRRDPPAPGGAGHAARCAGANACVAHGGGGRRPLRRGRRRQGRCRGLVKRIAPGAWPPWRSATPEDVDALRTAHRQPGADAGTPMFDLTGKTALVTGATRRPRRRHRPGAARPGRHASCCRAPGAEALEALRRRARRARCTSLPCDLADPAAGRRRWCRRPRRRVGPLDILVNNAGVTRDNLLLRMKDEDWDCVLAVEPDGRLPAGPRGAARA